MLSKLLRNISLFLALNFALCGCSLIRNADEVKSPETSADTQTEISTETENKINADTQAVWDESTSPDSVVVPILMFHNIKSSVGGTWEISADNFKNDILLLLNSGYTPISFEQLIAYVDGEAGLPEKPVCITFDDGYYSNYKYLLPLAEELRVPVTVAMVWRTIRDADTAPETDENILCKMSAEELRELDASPYVSVQSHTWGLHGNNTNYSTEKRDNILPLDGETQEEYKDILTQDCLATEKTLSELGFKNVNVLAYPSGKSCEWSEELFAQRGYRVTLTTDSSKVNLIRRGDKSSLFSLGRYNVNDDTKPETILRYLEKR